MARTKRPVVSFSSDPFDLAEPGEIGFRHLAAEDDHRLAEQAGISVKDARAVNDGKLRLSEAPSLPADADFDDFYDTRDLIAMHIDMHERRIPIE